MEPVKFVALSHNAKTGPAAAIYRVVGATCPSTCALLGNGCYAQAGNVAMHQNPKKGRWTVDPLALAREIIALPTNNLIRVNVTGDLLTGDGTPDWDFLGALQQAAAERPDLRWICYTHAWRTFQTQPVQGIHMLASCDTWSDVVEARQLGWRPALVVPSDFPAVSKAETGDHIGLVCPEQTWTPDSGRPKKICTTCLICTRPGRSAVFFRAHGPGMGKGHKNSKRLEPLSLEV